MSIQVVPVKDSNAQFPMALSSTSKHVVQTRQVQFLPSEATSFNFSGNNRIIINISSATEFLNGNNSYLAFNLQTSSAGITFSKKSLNIGGAHALFRTLEIRLQNGQLIERIDRYNKNYAVISQCCHSRDHVEWVEHSAGDSVSGVNSYDDGHAGLQTSLNGNLTDITLAGTLTVAAGSGNFTNELVVGDVITVYTKVGIPILTTTVTDVTTIDTLVVSPGPSTIVAGATGFTLKKVSSKPQRAVYADNSVHEVTLKLMSGFLNNDKFLPLKFMKQGLQLVLTLDDPRNVMTINQPVLAVDPALNYTITNTRFYAELYTYGPEMNKIHMDMFNGPGLKLQWQSYFNRQNIHNGGGASAANFSNNIGKRSCRAVYSVIQPAWTETRNNRSFNYDSCGQYMRSGLTRYQYSVGSEQFPYQVVEETSTDNTLSRTASQLQVTTRKHGGTVFSTRFSPSEWRSTNRVPGLNATAVLFDTRPESLALIISSRLDRDNSPWTGVNTEIQPLDMLFDFGSINFEGNITAADPPVGVLAAPASRFINSFIAFDAVMNVSSNGTTVLQ